MNMSSTTIAPPELADADLVALVLPFDEPISSDNPAAPLRYTWGDIPLPRKPLPLREGHDGRQIGLLDGFVLTRAGIWCRVKPGRTAKAMIDRGNTGISAEIRDRKLIGAALVARDAPAFASARLFGPAGVAFVQEATPRIAVSSATGQLVAFRPAPPEPPAATVPWRHAGNMTEVNRELAAASMAPVHAEIADRRRRFEERREELAQQDVDLEEARLAEAAVPIQRWPRHLPARKRWEEFETQRAAQAVAEDGEVAAAAFAERMARLEAAVRAARWAWWPPRRWFR
jgi:hypothetical protein